MRLKVQVWTISRFNQRSVEIRLDICFNGYLVAGRAIFQGTVRVEGGGFASHR